MHTTPFMMIHVAARPIFSVSTEIASHVAHKYFLYGCNKIFLRLIPISLYSLYINFHVVIFFSFNSNKKYLHCIYSLFPMELYKRLIRQRRRIHKFKYHHYIGWKNIFESARMSGRKRHPNFPAQQPWFTYQRSTTTYRNS